MLTILLREADLVQDMYLRELKSYKPSPLKLGDLDGQLQKFAIPQPPSAPGEGDIARDLRTYENQEVEVESAALEKEGVSHQEMFDVDDQENDRPH